MAIITSSENALYNTIMFCVHTMHHYNQPKFIMKSLSPDCFIKLIKTQTSCRRLQGVRGGGRGGGGVGCGDGHKATGQVITFPSILRFLFPQFSRWMRTWMIAKFRNVGVIVQLCDVIIFLFKFRKILTTAFTIRWMLWGSQGSL